MSADPSGASEPNSAVATSPVVPPGAWPVAWPLWIRALHWTLAVSMIAAFATHEGAGAWHERIGYVALAAAALRLLSGLVGPKAERLSAFVRGPRATLAYAGLWLRGRAPRYRGHNPLGAWMIVLLLLDALSAGFTGWLFTTDAYWGTAWLEDLHATLGEVFPPLLLLHILGAVIASRAHRENLVAAMVHGRKRPVAGDDIEK